MTFLSGLGDPKSHFPEKLIFALVVSLSGSVIEEVAIMKQLCSLRESLLLTLLGAVYS